MRRLILVLCCLIISGCTNNIYDEQLDVYHRLIDEVDSYNELDVSKNIPFDINVYFEKIIDEEITYRIIIDNPNEKLNNIKAIAIHNQDTGSIYPTTGIFEEPLNLVPNIVNLKDNNAKGIILVGYIDYDGNIDDFKGQVNVLIEYEDIIGNIKKIYYEYHK